MTTTDLPAAGPTHPPDALVMFRALTAAAVAMLALFALGLATDARTVGADGAWVKPAKFAASFVLLFPTVWAVAARLSPAVQGGRALRVTGLAMAVSFLAEMAYIAVQAGRGLPSHYYLADAFHRAMYSAMAVGATILVVSIAAVGVLAWRDRDARLGPATREGVFLGLAAFALPLMVVALTLGSGTGHHVGVHPAGGAVVPVLGWSLVAGDLRPAHFLALHAMQALPLAGLLADRAGWAPGRGRAAVRLAAAGWLALTAWVFLRALAGLPFVPV